MPGYDNPNGASLVMDLPKPGKGCPFWMRNHPVQPQP